MFVGSVCIKPYIMNHLLEGKCYYGRKIKQGNAPEQPKSSREMHQNSQYREERYGESAISFLLSAIGVFLICPRLTGFYRYDMDKCFATSG